MAGHAHQGDRAARDEPEQFVVGEAPRGRVARRTVDQDQGRGAGVDDPDGIRAGDERGFGGEGLRGRGFPVQVAPTMDLQAVLRPTKDPMFADPRLRQAVALALDVPDLVRAVTEGSALASRSPIPPASAFFTPAIGQVPARNIEEATRLAAAARL